MPTVELVRRDGEFTVKLPNLGRVIANMPLASDTERPAP